MVDIRGVIQSWFITLEEDVYVLIRIESLVALVTLMFLVTFILDIFRHQFGVSTVTTIVKTADDLSDHILVYLLGAMQSTDFYNPLFPVWAIVLVSLRASLGYLTGFGIGNREQRLAQVSNVLKFVGTGVLNGTRALEFTNPLWALWAILTFRSMYRYLANGWAVNSLWHGRSSEFLPEFMRQPQVNGQNYLLVYGESKQKLKIERPRYILQLDITHPGSLITLGKIQGCSGIMRSSKNCQYKDMSLAFTLSRLLRCRFEDVPLYSDSISSTRDLVKSEIIGGQHAVSEEEARRAMGILELELAFARDYFCTVYPVIFWQGLISLSFNLLQSIATFTIAFWLAVDIRNLRSLVGGGRTRNEHVLLRDLDIVITWVFMSFMMFKEVWEVVTYLISNWTKLLLVCKYVRNQCWFLGNPGLTENLTTSFFESKIVDPWHGLMYQYEFVQSCTYKATLWKLARSATLGKTPEKHDGRKSGDAIKVHECVKAALLEELRRLDLSGHQLRRENPSFRNIQIDFSRYEWAWLKMRSCSQVILVWHIATSLCEIRLAQDKDIDLSSPGFLVSFWSCLKKLGRCSSQPFLLDENIGLEGQLQINYRIANSLSRYCAYLLVFQSDLLPDSFIVPELVFETTLEKACTKLKECDLIKSRFNILMQIAQEAVQDSSEEGMLNRDIVQQGAVLAKNLIDSEDDETRWEILAVLWAKLLVHICPSWNAEAHKSLLESGGEFVSLIWALLWHCGIERSNMWCEDSVASGRNDDEAARETSTQATETTQLVEEQAANEDGNDDISAETESSNFIGRGRERGNAETDTEERTQTETEATDMISSSNFTN